MHVAAASYFPRESLRVSSSCLARLELPGRTWQQEVWPRHENKSRERRGSRASTRIFDVFPAVMCFFFSRPVASGGSALARAANCGTQRARPVNTHISTCQRDGFDMSRANLCSGVKLNNCTRYALPSLCLRGLDRHHMAALSQCRTHWRNDGSSRRLESTRG